MKTKKKYRIRNWSDYNRSLVSRGSITVWFNEEAIGHWVNQEKTGRKGRSNTYTDTAIECGLVLKTVYHLDFRKAEGFLRSVVTLLGLSLPVPDATTLERREKTLPVVLPRRPSETTEGLHIVVDSTGLKVYGEGEWKVRQHGYAKRRTWRKLHIGVDEGSGEIRSAVASTNDVSDDEAFSDLLEGVEGDVNQVSGDGAYDKKKCYEALEQRKCGTIAIPPRKNAKIFKPGNAPGPPHPRDENLRRIREVGRKRWKEEIGYHRRSLAETTMFRLKTLFGDRLSARTFDRQAVEMFTRCAVLNRMTRLGMPKSYAT